MILVEAAMGSALISGYKAISDIYKRHIDAKNGDLEQLKSCAAILSDNCKEWSRILIEAFDEAVKRWENEGRQAAENEIMRLQEDFLKLDYHYLEENSEIIIFLKNDFRFNSFADSCVRFYISALDVKKNSLWGN
jgi:hypothetical protein